MFEIGTTEGSIFRNIERSIHITDTQNKGCEETVLHCLLSKTGDSYTLYISGVDTTRIVTNDTMFLYIINLHCSCLMRNKGLRLVDIKS